MGLSFTLEDSDYAGLIEEGEIFKAKLMDIKERRWDDGGRSIEFRFRINSDGDPHDGTDVWGKTSDKFVAHPNCKLYSWSEALLGMKLPGGYNLDADDLLNRECQIIVGKREYTQNGEKKERNFVRDVMPTRENMTRLMAQDEDPF